MNILIDILPTSVLIGGQTYRINSCFRTSILFEQLIQDKTIEEYDKIVNTLELYYYPQIIPHEDIGEAIEQAINFYTCGRKAKEAKGKGKNQKKQIYSFEEDADFIYSAFMRDYKIDLTSIKYLHWWKFKSLFEGLNDGNKICEIMKIRCTNLAKIKDKEERTYYKEMQEIYKLKEETTEDDLKALDEWDKKL